MALPTTVVDDDTATTYVIVPCGHCGGDGITFVTVEEIRAAFATVSARFTAELSGQLADQLVALDEAV